MSQEDVQQLQMIEQNIQQLLVTKQSVQAQLIEIDSALEELQDSPEAWRVVGNIMVKKTPESLRAELEEKKKGLELRINTLEKQEERLRNKAQTLQQAVMEGMKDEQSQ